MARSDLTDFRILNSLRGPPFWDQAAASPARPIDTVAPGTLVAPGIITALPESPLDPWPPELSLWDTIKIAGMRAPGLPRVLGGKGKRIQVKLSAGSNGAVPTYLGEDPCDFSIRLTIWTPNQWKWLKQFVDLISPPATVRIAPKIAKVEYPALALIGIYDMYVVRVAIPTVDDQGRGTQEISCVEYLPSVYTTAGPMEATPEVVTNPDGTMTVTSKRSDIASPARTNTRPF